MLTTLATPEWQAFTQRFWGVEPMPLSYAPRGQNGPKLEAVLYTDRRGRISLPPYQPHLPIRFTPTATGASYRVQRQWLETASLLVEEMLDRGTWSQLTFSPEMDDPRPWRWAHFQVTPRFTNLIGLPFGWDGADRVVRQQAAKAERAGFSCGLTDDLDAVLSCLGGSQRRKGFAYGMTRDGLALAARLLGPDALRLYLARDRAGQPATARVILHRAGGAALDWMAGTRDEALKSGATQLLIAHALDDLHRAGAAGYNSCGADLEPVAHAKLMWGGTLAIQYSIQGFDWRSIRAFLGGWARFARGRMALRLARHPARSSGRGGRPAVEPSAGPGG